MEPARRLVLWALWWSGVQDIPGDAAVLTGLLRAPLQRDAFLRVLRHEAAEGRRAAHRTQPA
jgi:hypothetical protein